MRRLVVVLGGLMLSVMGCAASEEGLPPPDLSTASAAQSSDCGGGSGAAPEGASFIPCDFAWSAADPYWDCQPYGQMRCGPAQPRVPMYSFCWYDVPYQFRWDGWQWVEVYGSKVRPCSEPIPGMTGQQQPRRCYDPGECNPLIPGTCHVIKSAHCY